MRGLFILFTLCLSLPAQAHEYWIEPKSYTVPTGSTVLAGLFNGQNFKGAEFAFFPNGSGRFVLAFGDRVVPVTGRLGDRPALAMPSLGNGLHVAIYESAADQLIYNDFATFARFAIHKDFRGAPKRHADSGLPRKGFVELYTRHAKSLVAVGSGVGEDRAFGLLTEIVALKNPYTDDVTRASKPGLPVKVLYQNAPRPNAQVELFAKDKTGQVTVTVHRTNADGVAVLPVARGYSYLVDAVVLREPAAASPAAAQGAVWESLWAALTFAVPE